MPCLSDVVAETCTTQEEKAQFEVDLSQSLESPHIEVEEHESTHSSAKEQHEEPIKEYLELDE